MHFQSEKEFNFEEDILLKTNRITYTDMENSKTAYNPIEFLILIIERHQCPNGMRIVGL